MISGKFIGVKGVNTFEVRKKISVKDTADAKMYCACLGLFFVQINGIRVGGDYLVPGWSSYNNVLYLAEYDISQYLVPGENEVTITVNEGWYKGPLSWERKVNYYGNINAVCAQIDVDGEIIVTDLRWSAFTSPIISSSIYDGENVDLTALQKPLKLMEVDFDKSKIKKQICPFVQTIEKLKPINVIKKDDAFIYDFGQNFAGVVELFTPEDFDGTLTMRFGEILIDSSLYVDNLGSAKATDTIKCKGCHRFCPEFTYHGFRYMELKGIDKPIAEVYGCVRHTPMRRTGWIETSNERLNKLISIIVWSQRSNFVDIPTDCPQRAERLGWTGDINAFCGSAAFNYDIRKIMEKWLDDVAFEQNEKGEIPLVVPDVLGNYQSSAMWCDVIVNAPYTLYKMYGNVSFISDYYEPMKRFVECRICRAGGGLIKEGFELGDWLALDNDSFRDLNGRTDPYFIVNAFHVHSLKIICECAKLLGKMDDYERYVNERKKFLKAMRREYFSATGRFALDTLTGQALALIFDIVPKQYRARLAAVLDANIKKYHYRVVTGFVGTPFLLFALSDNGYHESACRVLLNNAYPGWLYEVDMGATTIWERWNSLMQDGKPNPDGMNSFNHYAYGSVLEFIYRRIAGIEPLKPGFKTFLYSPKPFRQISKIKARYLTDKGEIEAGYVQKGEKITFYVNFPKGFTAKVILPNGIYKTVKEDFNYSCEWENLDIPPFSYESTLNEIYNNPKAKTAFETCFKDKLHPLEINWCVNSKSNISFLQKYLEDKGRMAKEQFESLFSKFNALFLE